MFEVSSLLFGESSKVRGGEQARRRTSQGANRLGGETAKGRKSQIPFVIRAVKLWNMLRDEVLSVSSFKRHLDGFCIIITKPTYVAPEVTV